MPEKIVVANWKSNGDLASCNELLSLANSIQDLSTKVIISPPASYLYPLADLLKSDNIDLCAQNISGFGNGAYTGEMSATMLNDLSVKYCLVGHSERRSLFFDTDEVVLKKIYQAIENNITPIVCIGENLESFEKGDSIDVIKKQLSGIIDSKILLKKIIIAYEPIYAIGTNVVPEIDFISDMFLMINKILPKCNLLYGGSVNSNNIKSLSEVNYVSGFLVGGASMPPRNFVEMLKVLE